MHTLILTLQGSNDAIVYRGTDRRQLNQFEELFMNFLDVLSEIEVRVDNIVNISCTERVEEDG